MQNLKDGKRSRPPHVKQTDGDLINEFTHELKTPVSSIYGFARLLKSKNLTEAERDEYVDIILQESERLTRLSEGILLLARTESLSPEQKAESFNVTEQIRHVIILLQNKWLDKKIEVCLDSEDFHLNANKSLLEQVWINLIDNAIKFSPEGGKIHISIHKGQNDLIFAISDEGQGMDEETVKHAFERFYQGDTAEKGNGIGLSVVRRICELHGGSVRIAKSDKRGTSFEVMLSCE